MRMSRFAEKHLVKAVGATWGLALTNLPGLYIKGMVGGTTCPRQTLRAVGGGSMGRGPDHTGLEGVGI